MAEVVPLPPRPPAPARRRRAVLALMLTALCAEGVGVGAPVPASALTIVVPPPTPQSFLTRAPMRIVDTRTDGVPLGPGESRMFKLPVASVGTGPIGTAGYAMNITAVGPTHATHLTVYPWENGAIAPNTSFVNLRPGETRATLSMVKTIRSV